MKQVIEILKSIEAILSGHFVGTSGRHLETYLNKDKLYPHTEETSQVCMLFAEKFKNLDIDIVAAPAMGGIILSQWTAYHLSKIKGREILGVYAEKKYEDIIFTRGYDELIKEKNVLVIEDLTTTGGSVKKVIENAEKAGANVVAASVMVNRDPELINAKFLGVPFSPLTEFKTPSYDAKECPMCKNNIPVNINVGHGKKFLEEQKNNKKI